MVDALKLHDDINRVLLEKNVDRFEKYAERDDLATRAIANVDSLKGSRAPARFTTGYWKEWSKTHNILQRTSDETARSSLDRIDFRKNSRKAASLRPKGVPRKQKGFAFGPTNVTLPSKYACTPPEQQPPVAELFELYKHQSAPKVPLLMPLETLSKRGGAMTRGLPRPPVPLAVTSNASMSLVSELIGPITKRKSVPFSVSERFPAEGDINKNGAYCGPSSPKMESYQGRFGEEKRFVDELGSISGPGPQQYTVS